MTTDEQNMRELVRLSNSLRRVTRWHEKRIAELFGELSSDSCPNADDAFEFFELFVRGATKEEIADMLQVEPKMLDMPDKWGTLEW